MQDSPKNQLPCGVNEQQLRHAVETSGYPLQLTIAQFLQENFGVSEEWDYLDPDTRQTRTIDIHAEKYVCDLDTISRVRVRPSARLLIECKQSELPYVFFLSSRTMNPIFFPLIVGTYDELVSITTDDSRSRWSLQIGHALDLPSEPFISKCQHNSSVFSKCTRAGKNLELSGAEPFNSIIFPMCKALDYIRKRDTPTQRFPYSDLALCLGIAALDAPMIGITLESSGTQIKPIDWIRVWRQQKSEEVYPGHGPFARRDLIFGIDFVHVSFFREYIDSHLLPFAQVFGERVLKHQQELLSGKGFARGMDYDDFKNIERRLKPSKRQN